MTTVAELAKALGGKRAGEGWKAKCLFAERHANGDEHPSMSIFQHREGGAMLACNTECSSSAELMKEARRQGYLPNDLHPGGRTSETPPQENGTKTARAKGRRVAEYIHTDEHDNPLHSSVRLEPKDFFQLRKDGKGDPFKVPKEIMVLYKLPELVQAVKDGLSIFICEGHKDVLNLLAAGEGLGIAATTNANGAGNWHSQYNRYLSGADCIILEDNDEKGRKHSQQVAASLNGVAASVRILKLPNLPPNGGDVTDWLETGNTVNDLILLANAAAEWNPSNVNVEGSDNYNLSGPQPDTGESATWEDVETEISEIEWLWEGWLPLGQLSILAGAPDALKSALALRLCASITDNLTWPDGTEAPTQGEVIWCEAEHCLAPNIIRAKNFRFSRNRFRVPLPDNFESFRLDSTRHIDALRMRVERYRPKLIVVDALAAAHSLTENDSNIHAALGPLRQISVDYNVPALVIHHLKKGQKDRGEITLDDLRGSGAIGAAARSVIALDAPAAHQPEIKRIALIKHNFGSAQPPIGMEWKTIAGSQSIVFTAAPIPAISKNKTEEAEDIILGMLRKGVNKAKALEEDLRGRGYGFNTIRKAKGNVGAESVKSQEAGGEWLWQIKRDPYQ